MSHTTHLKALQQCVGQTNVLTGEDLAPLLHDWRGRYHGQALCAIRPGSTAEVAAVVRYCAAHGLPIVPQGGNTGLCGGATPMSPDAVLVNTTRLNRIRSVDAMNGSLVAEAGVTLSAIQAVADEADRLFPLSLASEGSCQLGGNLSTNAGGVQVLRYGTMRDLTLGLEVVLPNGDVWNGLRALRKDNTGYDLKHLMIGAEGTLGIITAAVLKLFPKPRSQTTVWVATPSPEAALQFLQSCQDALANDLTAFELISDLSLQLVLRHIPATRLPVSKAAWYVLCEFSSLQTGPVLASRVEMLLSQALDQGQISDAAIAQSDTQVKQLWQLRENISEAQKREGFSIKHDISVPVSSLPAFLTEMAQELETAYPGIRIVAFGHAGDGNLHYNLSHPASQTDRGESFLCRQAELNQRVHDKVAALNGSISAEHGLGQLKREEILRYKSSVEINLMRQIKSTLDPQGIMNPGKVI